jgi:uncharacterized protein YbaR (Trm112 family)
MRKVSAVLGVSLVLFTSACASTQTQAKHEGSTPIRSSTICDRCGNEYRIQGATGDLQVCPDPEGLTAGRSSTICDRCGNEYRIRDAAGDLHEGPTARLSPTLCDRCGNEYTIRGRQLREALR